jgi:hypothetical protein
MPTPQIPPLVDGFALNLQLPNCNQWAGFAMHQMEALRRAHSYHFHVFVAPEESTVPIAAYDTFNVQLHLPPGSWIWGITMQANTTSTLAGGGNATVMVRITDQGTQQMLFSNFAQGFINQIPPHGAQQLLSEPRVVIDPGILNIEIANPPDNGNVAIYAQVALWCAVPIEPRDYQYTDCPVPAGGAA